MENVIKVKNVTLIFDSFEKRVSEESVVNTIIDFLSFMEKSYPDKNAILVFAEGI